MRMSAHSPAQASCHELRERHVEPALLRLLPSPVLLQGTVDVCLSWVEYCNQSAHHLTIFHLPLATLQDILSALTKFSSAQFGAPVRAYVPVHTHMARESGVDLEKHGHTSDDTSPGKGRESPVDLPHLSALTRLNPRRSTGRG